MFVAPDQFARVLEILEPFEITKVPPETEVVRDGQARVWWGRNPIDLFFACDPVHEAMRERVRAVPFGDVEIDARDRAGTRPRRSAPVIAAPVG